MGTARQGACKRTLLAGHNRANTSIGRNHHAWRYILVSHIALGQDARLAWRPTELGPAPLKCTRQLSLLLITQRPLT
jgi:hypothetical protein